jgi:hypothetical protein
MVQVRTRGMSDSAQAACKKLWSTPETPSPYESTIHGSIQQNPYALSANFECAAKSRKSQTFGRLPAHTKKPHTPRRAANVWPRANVGKMSLAFDEFGRPFIIIKVRGRPVAAHPRSARKQRPAAISRVCPPPRDRLRLRVSAHLSDPSLRDDRSKATRAGSAASRRRRRTSRRRNLSRARSARPSAPRCVEQAIDLATPRGLGRHRNEHRFQTRPAKKKPRPAPRLLRERDDRGDAN